MPEQSLVVPEKYKWFAEYLKAVLEKINSALLDDITPSFYPYLKPLEAFEYTVSFLDRLTSHTQNLTASINRAGILLGSETSPQKQDVKDAYSEIEKHIEIIIQMRKEWAQKPFSEDLIELRYLLLEELDHLLREIYHYFKDLISLIEEPSKYITDATEPYKFKIELTFPEHIAMRIERFIKHKQRQYSLKKEYPCRESSSFWSFILGLIIGDWLFNN